MTYAKSLTGRDKIVAAANGTTSYDGVTYHTTASYIDGLLTPGSNGKLLLDLKEGKGRALTWLLGINHGIAIDGRVALLTIVVD